MPQSFFSPSHSNSTAAKTGTFWRAGDKRDVPYRILFSGQTEGWSGDNQTFQGHYSYAPAISPMTPFSLVLLQHLCSPPTDLKPFCSPICADLVGSTCIKHIQHPMLLGLSLTWGWKSVFILIKQGHPDCCMIGMACMTIFFLITGKY